MGSHQHLINHDFYNIPNLFVDLRSQEDFFDMTLATTEQIKNQFKAHKGGLILEIFLLWLKSPKMCQITIHPKRR